MKIWWRLRFWNNPVVSNDSGPLVKKTSNHCSMAIRGSLTPLIEVDYRSSPNKGNEQVCYSPEKWLHNRIFCPSNRSKQIQETHTACSAGTQYTRRSLNEKRHTWLHRQITIVCEAMYAAFHSNFAAHIVCWHCKPCEFPGFVWTDCWGNKSYYVITSPANTVTQTIHNNTVLEPWNLNLYVALSMGVRSYLTSDFIEQTILCST